MGGRSSLPTPGERSNSDFSGPPSLFWSPWLELGGAINKVLVLRLNTNSTYYSKIFQLQSCTRSTSYSLPLKHLPSNFPFQMNSLKCIHLNYSSLGMSSLGSLHWVLLLRFPRSFFWLVVINWATYSNPTFLGDHVPKCREVSTCNIRSVWGCCHLSFLLST